MPDLKDRSQKVLAADYSSPHGVSLRLGCNHTVYIPGFPRSAIPPCFKLSCKECAN